MPGDLTVARWPRHARYGTRAGLDNDAFLNAPLFQKLFARRLEPYAERVAALVFEFGTFAKSVFPTPADFLARLDPLLGALPKGFRYAAEIRNVNYFGPEYFQVLASHGVAHVFNAWTGMPDLPAQLDHPDAFTADFTLARALLRKGRAYENTVRSLEPYKLATGSGSPTANGGSSPFAMKTTWSS